MVATYYIMKETIVIVYYAVSKLSLALVCLE